MDDSEPQPEGRWRGRHLYELRWTGEAVRLVADPVFRGRGVTDGDGAPVLLIPGFLAGDSSLSVMRGWLRRMGYRAYDAGVILNVRCADRAVDRLERRLVAVEAREHRPVTLIGHSRGGHFAKALARRRPELIAGVVSLGAGLDRPYDVSAPLEAVLQAFRRVHAGTTDRRRRNGCFTATCRCRAMRDFAAPFPAEIPLTSIFSREDGVVRWQSCIVPYARNVEVTGSHVGLPLNRRVYRELAQVLAPAP